jgi:hypothetical protein
MAEFDATDIPLNEVKGYCDFVSLLLPLAFLDKITHSWFA